MAWIDDRTTRNLVVAKGLAQPPQRDTSYYDFLTSGALPRTSLVACGVAVAVAERAFINSHSLSTFTYCILITVHGSIAVTGAGFARVQARVYAHAGAPS